ncbi:MAG TPA: anhydro-N-acetylmuramic acid kinase [Sediminispirochaeta sp.]|nr:anhydro-N-acetylmuramic acid kinase [Sediminispirochaeta sp.]
MQAKSTRNDFPSSYRSKKEHTVVGLMSGTSLDGVDAVLVKIGASEGNAPPSVRFIRHLYLPYSEELRREIKKLCTFDTAKIDDLVYAHFGLSEWYAEAVSKLVSEAGLSTDQIDAVSMHGQTVWHAPVPKNFPGPRGTVPVKGTLQLGNPSVLSQRTGIPVVADLRSADMAAGGEGAPLAPYIDSMLFGDIDEGRIVQNIGGIGNATVLPRGGDKAEVFAFDTGPGNMVLDAIVEIGTNGELRYDPEGGIASRGRIDGAEVEALLEDEYFTRIPPKSTGREVYGQEFSQSFWERMDSRGASFEDIAATATAFTAESIARAYRDFVFPHYSIKRILVCGGGARNKTLMNMIRERVPEDIEVTTTDSYGVPEQVREAMAFALIGHQSLMGKAGNLPAVTGARAEVILGVLTL